MSREHIPGRYAMQRIIDEALLEARPSAVWVEVGVALGKGISYMAQKLLDAKRHDVTLYAVDPWGGYARNGEQSALADQYGGNDWALFLDMMKKNAPRELERIHIIRADSERAAFVFPDNSVDLCILDADHTYEAVCDDLNAWMRTIRDGGIIGGDDHHAIEFPGVVRACAEWFGSEYETWSDPVHNWPVWRHRVQRVPFDPMAPLPEPAVP